MGERATGRLVNFRLLQHCRRGDLPALLKCIESNANVDYCDKEGKTPLHVAAQSGFDAIVAALLEKHAKVDCTDKVNSCI